MKSLRPAPHTRVPRRHRSGPHSSAPSASGGAGNRWIYGRHAVAAALANRMRRWHRLAVLVGQEREADALVAAAVAARRGEGEPIRVLDREGMAAILPEDAVHQGFALAVEPLAEPDLA